MKMIDLKSEAILSLPTAAKSLPGRPHLASLYRWFQRGVRGVRLETILIGGKRFTSHEAIQRFADRLTAIDAGDTMPTDSRRRQQEKQDAKAKLDKARI